MYLPLYQWEVICDLCLNWTSYGYDLVLEPERKQNMFFKWNTPISEKKGLKCLKKASFMTCAQNSHNRHRAKYVYLQAFFTLDMNCIFTKYLSSLKNSEFYSE